MTGPRAAGDDAGQVLLLTIAYAVVALLLLTVVVSATAVHLDRKALLAVADQSALAGAAALDLDRYYDRDSDARGAVPEQGHPAEQGDPSLVLLSDATVARAVQDHLDTSVPARTPVVLVRAGTPDGTTAEVTLRTLSRPALLSWVTAPWSEGITLQVTSRARAR